LWIALKLLQGFCGQTVESFSTEPSPYFIQIYTFISL